MKEGDSKLVDTLQIMVLVSPKQSTFTTQKMHENSCCIRMIFPLHGIMRYSIFSNLDQEFYDRCSSCNWITINILLYYCYSTSKRWNCFVLILSNKYSLLLITKSGLFRIVWDPNWRFYYLAVFKETWKNFLRYVIWMHQF